MHLNYPQELDELKDMGFEIPRYVISRVGNAPLILKQFEESKKGLNYDIDGVVARISNNREYEELGLNGSKTKPRGAFAMKFPTQGHFTEILDIEWSAEGGEYICPVAILSPVMMDKSEVSRARIKAVDIYSGEVGVGSKVELHMAGEIIPHIKKILTKPATTETTPEFCEHCSKPLFKANTGLTCDNPDCSNKQAHAIVKFLKTLRIKGCGMEVARQAVEEGLTIDKLFKKDVKPLTQRFSKNWGKVMTQIKNYQGTTLQKILEGSPIKGFGRGSSIKVSEYAPTLSTLYELKDSSALTFKMIGLTEGNRESFKTFLNSDMFSHYGDWLMVESESDDKEDTKLFDLPNTEWSGLLVAMTGSPDGYHKAELVSTLEGLGATVRSSISKSTELLFASSKVSSKAKKAQAWGIETLNYPKKLV